MAGWFEIGEYFATNYYFYLKILCNQFGSINAHKFECRVCRSSSPVALTLTESGFRTQANACQPIRLFCLNCVPKDNCYPSYSDNYISAVLTIESTPPMDELTEPLAEVVSHYALIVLKYLGVAMGIALIFIGYCGLVSGIGRIESLAIFIVGILVYL